MEKLSHEQQGGPPVGMLDVQNVATDDLARARPQLNRAKSDFVTRRHEYILIEIRTLNENVFRYLALYQRLVAAVLGAGVAIVLGWQGAGLNQHAVHMALKGLLAIFNLLGVFVVAMIGLTTIAWLDYRREEVAHVDAHVESGLRASPSFRHCMRWTETHIVVFVIAVSLLVNFYVRTEVIPNVTEHHGTASDHLRTILTSQRTPCVDGPTSLPTPSIVPADDHQQ